MRAFVRLRRTLLETRELARRIDALEEKTDGQFQLVFDAIRALVNPEVKPKRRIGYLSAAPTPA